MAGATRPAFQSAKANVILTAPTSAAPSTRTVSCRRQLQQRCLRTARTTTGGPPDVLLGNSRRAVGYTSSVSQRDYYEAERRRELAEIEGAPEAEREEIRKIYAAKGFSGRLLERVDGAMKSRIQLSCF